MSDDNESVEGNSRTGSKKRSTLALIVAIVTIGLAFFVVHEMGYRKGKDVSSEEIKRLKGELNSRGVRYDSLDVELDSLKKITRADSSVVCEGRRTTFLNGRIIVGLHRVVRVSGQWPQASFRITDVITGEESSFSTSDTLNHYEFRSGDEDYILYFDGYAKVEGEINYCAKVALRKKSHVGPEQGKQILETNAPSPP